jgi:hypothetical protein
MGGFSKICVDAACGGAQMPATANKKINFRFRMGPSLFRGWLTAIGAPL